MASREVFINSGLFGPKLCSSSKPNYSSCPWSQSCMPVSITNCSAKFQITCCNKSLAEAADQSRRSANYQPSFWDYNRIHSLGTSPEMHEQDDYNLYIDYANLLEEVRCLMRDEQAKSSVVLQLIDDIERLGLKYHFEDDVISALHRVLPSQDLNDNAISSLHYASLRFRLLRQHGFEVSQEIFEMFKGEDGMFKEQLSEDLEGMLSLYEASLLAFEGEVVLDEAKAFTRKHLSNILNLPLMTKNMINHALELPLHRRMRQLEARWTAETYNDNRININQAILLLAKSHFNFMQSVYQRELRDLARWWKALGLSTKLSFSRADRVMENYFWSVGMVSVPHYNKCRKALTKVAYFITVIDDIYDVYGTIDELELFTSAVERWDMSMVNDLPDYMKLCFLALYNTTNEIAYEILQDRGQSVISYLVKAWADLLKTFIQEARWSSAKYTPNFEEYLNNAWLSSSGPLLMVHAYFFMSNNIDLGELESLRNYHELLRLPSLIFRLCNDSATSKAEMERGDVAKGAICYMKETGKSEEEAQEHIANLIEETWKKLNKEATKSSLFPQVFKETALDLARIAHVHYQYGDGHGTADSRSKNRVTSLFIQPIS